MAKILGEGLHYSAGSKQINPGYFPGVGWMLIHLIEDGHTVRPRDGFLQLAPTTVAARDERMAACKLASGNKTPTPTENNEMTDTETNEVQIDLVEFIEAAEGAPSPAPALELDDHIDLLTLIERVEELAPGTLLSVSGA